jgi:glyoxylase-like metal-dependent hydrolase (beta-lactamase superfamily II)
VIVAHYRLNPIEVNCFIIACPKRRDAMLIDCGEFDMRIGDFVTKNDLNLNTIFVTHDHYDHTDGVAKAAERFGAQVVSGVDKVGGVPAYRVMKPGETINVGTLKARAVDTSGHTPIGLSLIFDGVVFSGDALFAGSVGGTSNQEDYDRQIANVRKNLLSLPEDYIVYTGHGPATTIGIEKHYNPFFV